MNKFPAILTILLAALNACAAEPLWLENDNLAVRFDAGSGTLTAIENKLTGETYQVQGDEFQIEAVEFRLAFSDAKPVNLLVDKNTLKADYRSGDFAIGARCVLRGHFVEKQLTLTCTRDYGLKKLILSRPRVAGSEMKWLAYWYPKTALPGEFALTAESIGLEGKGAFSITQKHPAPGRTQTARTGETVRWEVPAQTAVVVKVQPAAD